MKDQNTFPLILVVEFLLLCFSYYYFELAHLPRKRYDFGIKQDKVLLRDFNNIFEKM